MFITKTSCSTNISLILSYKVAISKKCKRCVSSSVLLYVFKHNLSCHCRQTFHSKLIILTVIAVN